MPWVTREFSFAFIFSLRAIGIRRDGWTTGGTAGAFARQTTNGIKYVRKFLDNHVPFRLDLDIGMGFMSCWDLRSSIVCAVSLFVAGGSDFTAKSKISNLQCGGDWSPSNIGPFQFTTWNVAPINLSRNLTPSQHVPSWSTVVPPKAINRIEGLFQLYSNEFFLKYFLGSCVYVGIDEYLLVFACRFLIWHMPPWRSTGNFWLNEIRLLARATVFILYCCVDPLFFFFYLAFLNGKCSISVLFYCIRYMFSFLQGTSLEGGLCHNIYIVSIFSYSLIVLRAYNSLPAGHK